MLEINPVLTGTYNQPNYPPAATNLTTGTATENANGVDARRYTQFDRTAADSGTADFSFGDFLDLINPLQHIPLVSEAYRSITGDSINPVSRVAGDILYGGAMGGVSALAGGAGAVADEVFQAQTGKGALAYVADALFGSGDGPGQTQIASTASTALAASPATSPAAAVDATAPAAPTANSSSGPAAPGAIPLAKNTPVPLASGSAKSLPLNGNKLPYGGVMDTGNATQAQNLAIALSAASPNLRLGHTIYTGRLMNGANPVASSAQPSAVPTSPQTTSSENGNGGAGEQNNPLPQGLVNDIMALKALNQYKSTASAPPATGSMVNITN